ncbi:MAG: radical SAM protein [bacterium]|uniref:Radical SAM domain protein n=2 Tax=Bacteria candidate phyla TaxID=1783234 RepID=A0A101I301_UNCT6|nr:MAG: Radical SAM domain protein [candidate division TA06 bacterium 32_111]KUK88056.1 MAG: Radical SAM domain protein [candidate division TA06 bacterium 34_109]MDI6700862.1 radical SAM protein [bacterium]HAF06988.1 radical SAM protein [candidate division WOR-3 bacterium]HCP16902.1 radical SAM protein [candidate division WOR-3 bacterium]
MNRRNAVYFITKQTLRLLSLDAISKIALPPIEKVACKPLVDQGCPIKGGPRREREDKFFISANLIYAALKAFKRGSPAVRDRLLNLFLKEFLRFGDTKNTCQMFRDKYGVEPPGFLTLSPEGRCNLHCKDCYAASLPKDLPHLTAATVEQILQEKYEKWGSWFTVISGGEPFMWHDDSMDIIEIAKRHQEQYFLVYTNGTFINKKTAERLAEVGNITPAVSVEGFEKETDERRGKGTFRRILDAFKYMRNAGVPFGISVTANVKNAHLLVSEEMVKFYFDEQGALYEWIFQYMPIGRGVDVSLQVSPLQRQQLWQREQELVRKERRFIADFWNGGTFSSGCISAGRPGGYLYIDWNGNIYPCVFIPYWKDNINELYAQGKTMTDALFSDLFKGIRDWQRSYNYMREPHCRGNEIVPCFIRDHYEVAHDLFLKTNAKPGYPSAGDALRDPEYFNAMIQYDKKVAELLDPIWEKLYREY